MNQTYREGPSGFHPVSVGHLTTGTAVLGLVGAWALWQFGPTGDDDVRWLVAAPWVLAGVVGLVASALTGGRRHRTHGPVEPGWVGGPSVSDRAYEPPTAPQTVQQTVQRPVQQPVRPSDEEQP